MSNQFEAFSLADVPQLPIRLLSGTVALSAGGITTATTTTDAKIVNTITFMVDGFFKSKGATDNFFVLPTTVSVILPGGSGSAPTVQSSAFGNDNGTGTATRYFFFGLDASGNAYTYISNAPAAAEITASGNPGDASNLPLIDSGVCIVGMAKVTAANSATFTPGTTALSTAGNYTVTFYDIAMIPSVLP